MNYSIKLLQFNFDKTYDDARFFANKGEQSHFFDNAAGKVIDNVNFIANDLINVSITFRSDESTNLKTLLNYNYCVVTNETTQEKMFYWVNSSKQSSGGVIVVDAEIDELQTYIYDIEFARCLINRAHLDRFESVEGTNSYKFKGDAQSELFEREPVQDVAKRLVERRKLKLKRDSSSELETTFDDYVINRSKGWVYVYLSAGTYNTKVNAEVSASSLQVGTVQNVLSNIAYKIQDQSQAGGTAVLCYPLSSNFEFESYATKQVAADVSQSTIVSTIKPSARGFEAFLQANSAEGGAANIYAIKYSIMPPFKQDAYAVDRVENDKAILQANWGATIWSFSDNMFIVKTGTSVAENDGLIVMRYQDLTPARAFLDNNIKDLTFNKDAIKSASNSPVYNPKILSEDYSEIVLSIYGNNYKYDLQKLNNSKPSFLYYEALTPDVTKSLLVYDAPTADGVYIPATKNNYSGLMSTIDNSILFSSTQLEQYLANNKNAFLSFQTNQVFSAAKGVVGAGVSAASTKMIGGPTNPLLAGLGAGAALMKTGLDLTQEAIQFNLSIDNMRSAPNQLVNANGNAVLLNAISEIGAYIELYEILPNEKKVINDFMHQFGYAVNKIDKPENYFKTRVAFNYIKCTLTNIDGQISNTIKERLKRIFENGVRLWHQDSVDFTVQNYERYL